MLNIKHIDHIVLRVVDADAMKDFYIKVIGCSLEQIQEGPGLVQLRAGTSLIDLVQVDGKIGKMGGAAPGKGGRNVDHFCLSVEPFDADAIIAFLRQNGVEAGPVESRYGAEGEGPSIYLADPEGNGIELKGPPWPTA